MNHATEEWNCLKKRGKQEERGKEYTHYQVAVKVRDTT